MSTHHDPHCVLVDAEGLPHWVGWLDHFLAYEHEPPFDAALLEALERKRDAGGEVLLTGGACAGMTLRIQAFTPTWERPSDDYAAGFTEGAGES